MIEQNWILWDSPASYSWTPPAGTVSGAFIAKLKSQNGYESYIPFVVRDDARTSDYLFQTAVTTYQAYNIYPGNLGDADWRSGKSLYNGLSFGPLIPENPNAPNRDRQARAVSFNRPYFPDNLNIHNSAGQFFQWEYNMVRWLEKEGYDVTYQTDVDTHARPETLTAGKHKVLLSVGHDEYWSWQMRDVVEQARNRTNQPLNIGFFGANISHWQIRFADSTANTRPANAPNRTIVAYKNHAQDSGGYGDPVLIDSDLTNNYLTTNLWRENQNPLITLCPAGQPNCNCPANIPNCTKQPEDELIGVMTDLTNPTGSGDFEFATDAPAWVKAGLPGQEIVFPELLGYEADRIFNLPNYPNRTWSKIGDSIFVGKGGNTTPSHAVYYRMTTGGGARVFATGTIQWAWGLDKYGADTTYGPAWHANLYNADVEVVTRNVLACLKNGGVACGGN